MAKTSEKPLILIADDRSSSRELLRLVLERAGYSVMEAEDGVQALERTRNGSPDLVLLDLQMPGMDGYQVLAALRSEARFAHLPVLALTASAMRGDREKIMDAGFTDYLAKPAGPEVLRETVARMLGDAADAALEREESA
jgi:two-component system cell cycle response regulator DivK